MMAIMEPLRKEQRNSSSLARRREMANGTVSAPSGGPVAGKSLHPSSPSGCHATQPVADEHFLPCSLSFPTGRFAFPFAEDDRLVRGLSGKEFLGPIRPHDFKSVHTFGRTQAEVSARIVATEVTVSEIDP